MAVVVSALSCRCREYEGLAFASRVRLRGVWLKL